MNIQTGFTRAKVREANGPGEKRKLSSNGIHLYLHFLTIFCPEIQHGIFHWLYEIQIQISDFSLSDPVTVIYNCFV
jgi:hypothetical protein